MNWRWVVLIMGMTLPVKAQDLHYARSTIELLSGPGLHGRGYVEDGHQKAAAFIANEFKEMGLQGFDLDYQQPFPLSVNTFPGKMEVALDGQKLKPGIDYLVDPASPGLKGKFDVQVIRVDTLLRDLSGWVKEIKQTSMVVMIIKTGYRELDPSDRQIVDDVIEVIRFNEGLNIPALVVLDSAKLTWGASRQTGTRPVIYMNKHDWQGDRIKIHIQSQPEKELMSQNVLGLIKGKRQDSVIVVTAHYDHLGRMGRDTYFPGANDNASGVAMMLSLARHFSFFETPPYDLLFIAFGGEEAGLVGSTYYTGRPVYPLKRTKFLINLDIVGTGDDGIKVVNGKIYEQQFQELVRINEREGLLPEVSARGQACNSDHCPFDQFGIPAFFIYTLGGIQAYHDVYDRADTLPMTEYEDLFRLLKEFVLSFR